MALARRKRTPADDQAFDALSRWTAVWGNVQPEINSLRRVAFTTRLHAWDDVIVPAPGRTNEDLAYAFLPAVMKLVTRDDKELILCTSSWSYADGTRPKPLRAFAFLDQAYWGSVAVVGDDEAGQCMLTHVFVSWTQSGGPDFARVARTVIDTEAVGVIVMPKDLRWCAYLYHAGIDVAAQNSADITAFNQAALTAEGRPAPPRPGGWWSSAAKESGGGQEHR